MTSNNNFKPNPHIRRTNSVNTSPAPTPAPEKGKTPLRTQKAHFDPIKTLAQLNKRCLAANVH